METPENLKRKTFLEVVSNYNLSIYFHEEKYQRGKIWLDTSGDVSKWRKDQNQDYWDFDVEINGYKVSNLLEDETEIRYYEYLSPFLEEFKELHSIDKLRKLSKANCYDLLINTIDYLNGLRLNFSDYHTKEESPDEDVARWTTHERVQINTSDVSKFSEDDYVILKRLSTFFSSQKKIISEAIQFLERKKEWLNLTDKEEFENLSKNDMLGYKNNLVWCKNDTDLLELITALCENKAINNSHNNLTRKEAIEIFSKVFNRDIKDAESKLSKATERKKDISPFLSALKESFDNYAIRKEQK